MQKLFWFTKGESITQIKDNLASTRILSDSIKIRKKLIDFDHPLC